MIVLPNMDGKIWQSESRLVDMMTEIIHTGKLEIDLNHEGPCAESVGLYQLLDYLCVNAEIDKSDITITTWNLIEQHPQYRIVINPLMHLHKATKTFDQNLCLQKHKQLTDMSKHIGLFIGRSNWVRLWIASHLYRQYRKQILLTYHWQSRNDFHSAHIGIDDMLIWQAPIDDARAAFNLLADCPITLDKIDQYPLLLPENLGISRFYKNFFVEVVCETYFTGRCFFPTEKIWRPIMMKTPFIVHGPLHYLKHLQQLGFRTFDRWWNEDYDDYGHNLRIVKILSILEDLIQLDHKQLYQLYQDMYATLEHNYQIFCDLDGKQVQIASYE